MMVNKSQKEPFLSPLRSTGWQMDRHTYGVYLPRGIIILNLDIVFWQGQHLYLYIIYHISILIHFCQGQHNDEEHGGDFISEARDWAGELISAQTMMGKILVRL